MTIKPVNEVKSTPSDAGDALGRTRTSELDLTKGNTGSVWRQYLGAIGPGLVTGASDGSVFSFALPFEGSAAGTQLAQPIVGTAFQGDDGYWLVAADGKVFSFGTAPFLGSGA